MSLYRQPGRTRGPLLAAVAAAALLVGGAIGYAIGHGSAKQPSARDAVAQLHKDLRPAVNGLQLLPTEYPQAARGAGNESAAVTGALDRMRAALSATHADLVALDPVGARLLDQRVTALEAAVGHKDAPARVAQLTRAASDALSQVPGGGD